MALLFLFKVIIPSLNHFFHTLLEAHWNFTVDASIQFDAPGYQTFAFAMKFQ